jgi:hypothetical protein
VIYLLEAVQDALRLAIPLALTIGALWLLASWIERKAP